jgi:hypothetical protein
MVLSCTSDCPQPWDEDSTDAELEVELWLVPATHEQRTEFNYRFVFLWLVDSEPQQRADSVDCRFIRQLHLIVRAFRPRHPEDFDRASCAADRVNGRETARKSL